MAQSAAAFEETSGNFLVPRVRFREGVDHVKASLRPVAERFGVGARTATARGRRLREAARSRGSAPGQGRKALAAIEAAERETILLLGRPYNLYDAGVNLGIPRKLRDF